jgi:hypothetical protein
MIKKREKEKEKNKKELKKEIDELNKFFKIGSKSLLE